MIKSEERYKGCWVIMRMNLVTLRIQIVLHYNVEVTGKAE